ncbi:hypothetical protein AQUCO_00600078v1 [Aquilegia coerulea]|uniref:Disease resistance R13L4/SHOC-2-like LRR domain-containing protein n=1 Tax=Aquilegia coerulea TaxID=218851 RepID=A0A2G5EN33_AQUCA|nr:hypothetical protein AQUCO_00600078v1 [Aquilegia coerulea]
MGSSCFSLSLLLVLVITVSELVINGDSKTHKGDIKVLKELKKGLDPSTVTPGSCVSSWDFSVDPCDHIFSEHFSCGFRCDVVVSKLSRVTEISLDRAGYTGSLSSTSWNLPYLQTLDLSENYFNGIIPNSLSKLKNLRRLALSRNSFYGEIPSSIGSLAKLEELYLDNNHLQGSIPSSFHGLVSLQRLELQENNLTGEYPNLGSLKNLIFLDTSDNAISGQFPSTLPASLIEISMRNNYLQGNLPDNFGNLGFLQVMDLSQNQLSGTVPWSLFNHPSLQQLTLSHNKLTFLQMPINMGIQSELIALDLSNNEFQGLLPGFIAMMPKLSALSVENNKFTGMIPSQYALKAVFPVMGTSPFARLLLGGNYFFGPIPEPLMGLKPGSANVSLVDNCLYRCPTSFFFCQGRVQKSVMACKRFGPVIP